MAKSKRELDKEMMFNKIMPSGIAIAGRNDSTAPKDPIAASPGTPAEQARVAAPKQPAFTNEAGVQLKDKRSTVIVNIMERLVLDKLDSAFSKFNCCKCDRCKKDVVALALNKLAPKYVVAEQDRLRDFIAVQTQTEVTTALVQAIITVRANPRH